MRKTLRCGQSVAHPSQGSERARPDPPKPIPRSKPWRRWPVFVLVAAWFTACVSQSLAAGLPQHRIEPRHPVITLPEAGLVWLPGEDFAGVCDVPPADAWIRKPGGGFDLLVHAEGPSGSGRYWVVTVALGRPGEAVPRQGVCFQTSTLGWRTLQDFSVLPLPWAEDLDDDGTAEVLIWDSFPTAGDGSTEHFGLMVWVYRVAEERSFGLDWDLTRAMATELVAAYRRPLERGGEELQRVRNRIARALEQWIADTAGTAGSQGSAALEAADVHGTTGQPVTVDPVVIDRTASPLMLKPGEEFSFPYPKHASVGLGARYRIEDPTVVAFVREKTRYTHPQRLMPWMTGGDVAIGTFVFRALQPGTTSLIIRKDFRGQAGEVLISTEIIVQ
jgi:hypothetical protein